MTGAFEIKDNVLIKYHGKEETAVVPEGVAIIRHNAFEACITLNKIILPESITKIEHSAFEYCTNLESLNIPESVITIGNSPFWGCERLTSLATKYGGFPLQYHNCWKILPDVFSIFSTEDTDEISSVFPRTLEKLVQYSALEIIRNILQSEKFACLLNPELTDKLIRLAIEKKHYQIQLLLTDYKYQHFGFRDVSDKLKL